MIYGKNFAAGDRLFLRGNSKIQLSTSFIDSEHLGAVVSSGILSNSPDGEIALSIGLTRSTGETLSSVTLTLVDDVSFPTPYDLACSADGQTIFVAQPTSDELWVYRRSAKVVERIPVGDGPRALHVFDWQGGATLGILHQYSGELWLTSTDNPAEVYKRMDVGKESQDFYVSGNSVWVTNHWNDSVNIFDLGSGAPTASVTVGVNPRPLSVTTSAAYVGNLASSDVSVLQHRQNTITSQQRMIPKRNTPILGGHTEPYSQYIMGGKSARAIVASEKLGVAFVASIGPNIGPNPDHMEISMNGGVSVLHPQRGFLRHVSLGGGIPQDLALDEDNQLLFAADVSTGRLVALDTQKLTQSDTSAKSSIVASLVLPAPDPKAGFLHVVSAAQSVAIDRAGTTAFVLDRLSGRILIVDVRGARSGSLKIVDVLQGPGQGVQIKRRLGEALYFSDLGHTGMSCDGCHREGHVDGLLYTKTRPIHIYRAPTLRGIRETAPYFTPSELPSLEKTAEVVMGRNRFHNPLPTPSDIAALAHYQKLIVPLPNPNLAKDGSLPETIVLPDNAIGHPQHGLAIFNGKGGCSNGACHPPPHFTGDQDKITRGNFFDVGTPITLPLREKMQDMEFYPVPPQSLTGLWDTFPLLYSGAAGYSVQSDETVAVTENDRFALRKVLDFPNNSKHGAMAQLNSAEKNDLLAYLLTL